jgi:hypothetical protein
MEEIMEQNHRDKFPPEVSRRLQTYVYRLIDPRNGETFYVGKGKGDRVFAHIRGEVQQEGDELNNKLKRIREIKRSGLEVGHVIHRHGMDDKTAFEVESALIDAYSGLTNIIGGSGNSDFGSRHALEIIRQYTAEPADIKHKVIIICINRSIDEKTLYEATRLEWKLNPTKANKADFILATRQGMIVGVFIAEKWLPVTAANFPGREESPGRYGFNGKEADQDIQKHYIGKRIPDKYRKRGAANPIKYSWEK